MNARPQQLWNEILAYPTPSDRVALWWLGQLGFVFKFGDGTILLTDPFLSDRPDRLIPPQLNASLLKEAHYILGTHDHDDHIDRELWREAAQISPSLHFILPEYHKKDISSSLGIAKEQLLGLTDSTKVKLGDIRITAIAAAHELLDPHPDTGLFPCLSYIIEWKDCRILHSGDACIYDGLTTRLQKHGPYDLVILPINGRDAVRLSSGCIGNMTYQEAVDLTGALSPRLCVPGHFDMFANNSANPQLFQDYLNVKYPDIPSIIPEHGKLITI